MIHYLCGHRGCGKNHLASKITRNVPIEIIDTGPIIREAYQKYKRDNISFKDWIKENEEKYGENFTNKLISKLITVKKGRDYIVIGYRSIEGIEYFNRYFGIENYRIYFIDGDYELFRENYNEREKKEITKEEYGKIVEVENTMGIEKLKEFVLKNKDKAEYYFKRKNDDIIYQDVLRKIKNRAVEEEKEL